MSFGWIWRYGGCGDRHLPVGVGRLLWGGAVLSARRGGIGFCLYFMTFGLISSRVVRFVRKILDFCLFRPLKCIFHALAHWIRRKAQWIEGKVKKSYAKRKKRLKPRRKIVYNDANKPMERKTSGKKAEREGGTRIMKVIKRKKQRGSLLLKLAIFAFARLYCLCIGQSAGADQ